MNIGVFGGCFNPPHNMHKQIAKNLIQKDYLDKVIFVPTGSSYNKRELRSIDERMDMLKLLIDSDNIDISDICRNNNYEYTYQVLDYFQNKNPQSTLYFICGTDNLDEFETWQRYEYILERYKLLVIKRNNDNINELLRKYAKYKGNIRIANIDQNQVSSTLIREIIKKNDYESLLKYMDKNVLKYIKKKGLYKN